MAGATDRRLCAAALIGALIGLVCLTSSCTKAPIKKGASAGDGTSKKSVAPDVLLRVGDETRLGAISFSVEATRASRSRLFDLPKGSRPPRGREWVIADAVVQNTGRADIDVESLLFTLSSRSLASPAPPASQMIATDRSKGLDLSGVLHPGDKMAMSLAFAVDPKDRKLRLNLRIAETNHDATVVLR